MRRCDAEPSTQRIYRRSAPSATARDTRAPIYRQLQAILNEDLPSLVLFDEETVDFASRKLSGLWPAIDARDQWGGVRLAAG